MKLSDVLDEVRRLEVLNYKLSSKIFFLRNFTIENIEPFLKVELLRAGIKPEIQLADYSVIEQEILNNDSSLHKSAPEVVVLSLFLDNLPLETSRSKWSAESITMYLRNVFDLLKIKTSALIVVNTFIPPMNADRSGYRLISDLNNWIYEFALLNSGRFVISDWLANLTAVGTENSLDYRFWYMSKAPFKNAFIARYADDIVAAVKTVKGKAKKCLVLDCDNTLWGGIIGEDGLNEIKLDPNTYPGNIFYNVHRYLLELHDRGVILALNSKNNPEDVNAVFETHPHCLLKKEHFAAERINWADKVTNMNSLAEELNIGLDSFVFVDDNSIECDFVRQSLPEVKVIQVPKDLYSFPQLLYKQNSFSRLGITAEDKNRTKMYREEKQRNQAKVNTQSLEEYLASLEIKAHIREVKREDISRVAQLTQKTNQFNLTTRRYSEGQIEQFVSAHDSKVFALSVSDKFGELGLTGVLIAKKVGKLGHIDSLLVSCRVLGRSLETAFVSHCMIKMGRDWDVEKWAAEYLPTNKNIQTKNFWNKLGFSEVEALDGVSKYSLTNRDFRPQIPNYIKIEG